MEIDQKLIDRNPLPDIIPIGPGCRLVTDKYLASALRTIPDDINWTMAYLDVPSLTFPANKYRDESRPYYNIAALEHKLFRLTWPEVYTEQDLGKLNSATKAISEENSKKYRDYITKELQHAAERFSRYHSSEIREHAARVGRSLHRIVPRNKKRNRK